MRNDQAPMNKLATMTNDQNSNLGWSSLESLEFGPCLELGAWNLNIRKDHRARAGHLLMEMLIVVAIMGILSAMAITQFSPMVPTHLVAVAEIVAADLQYARGLAIANSSKYKLTFEPANNRFILTHSGTNTALNTLPYSPFRKSGASATQLITVLDQLLPAGPKMKLTGATTGAAPAAVTELEFREYGQTTAAEATTVWIQAGSGKERLFISVAVDPVTGLTSIGKPQSTVPTGLTAAN